MSWAKIAIERLARGERVTVRPSGHSMSGRINHRDEVVLAPVDPEQLQVDDAVLVRVAGQVYLHLVKAIDRPKRRVLIGNNRGGTNGWASFSKVFGIAVMVAGRELDANTRVQPEETRSD